MERRIYNPIQKDAVVFLKTAGDTNGECTLVEGLDKQLAEKYVKF